MVQIKAMKTAERTLESMEGGSYSDFSDAVAWSRMLAERKESMGAGRKPLRGQEKGSEDFSQ